MSDALPDHLLAAAARLLPSSPLDGARLARGQFHDVVLLPGVAAVRVARDERSAQQLPRRTTALHRLRAALPFAVPRPLTEVHAVEAPGGSTTAVAHSWLPGRPHPPHGGDPRALADLLSALAAVPTEGLADVLDVPHGYAGGRRWAELAEQHVLPRLLPAARARARQRIEAVQRLEREPTGWRPGLVHTDLAGHNAHWDGGRLVGVLDWDFACAWDPAVDVACLADWHGWHAVAKMDDPALLQRARARHGVFRIEQAASAVSHGASEQVLEQLVQRVAHELAAAPREPASRRG